VISDECAKSARVGHNFVDIPTETAPILIPHSVELAFTFEYIGAASDGEVLHVHLLGHKVNPSGTMESAEDRAHEILQGVLERPLMWAATREAYVAKLSTLLDVLGFDGREVYRIMMVPGSPAVQEPGARLDKEWAALAGERAKAIFESRTEPTGETDG